MRVLAHGSPKPKFLGVLGKLFLVGLVFLLPVSWGEVMLCFSEIRKVNLGLSQSQAISDFPKHLALVELCAIKVCVPAVARCAFRIRRLLSR